MNYSLGNMLSGNNGSLNPDKLSLDLQFAADKTLTARKGPTPTFTRASTATFVGSNGLIQSAAINAARFDHDPITLDCKGLLIEESRTNLITYSEDMSAANGWSEDGGSVAWVNNATSSPAGDTTAEKLKEGVIPTSNRHLTVKAATLVTGTSYTLSVFAKASERSFLQLGTATGFTLGYMNFDLSNGTVGSGDLSNPIITDAGNGWYRCSVTVVSNLTGNGVFTFGIVPLITSGRFAAYVAVEGNGLYLWGAQLEAGSFPTSYIPTTTSSVVRSQDLCSITGSDFTSFYNQSEGTMFSDISFPVLVSVNRYAWHINDGSNNNSYYCFYTATPNFTAAMLTAGSAQLTGTNFNTGSSLVIKSALAIANNNSAFSANGATAITDTSVTLPSVNDIKIGSRFNNTSPLNGHIASIRYYKKRLANAKLQTLTT